MSEILNRAVTKGRGPGAGGRGPGAADFPWGTMSMTPVYFHRKQKENENKKNSLAIHFPTY